MLRPPIVYNGTVFVQEPPGLYAPGSIHLDGDAPSPYNPIYSIKTMSKRPSSYAKNDLICIPVVPSLSIMMMSVSFQKSIFCQHFNCSLAISFIKAI
jgi:hypothetical protein